jgi:hypothetical protein
MCLLNKMRTRKGAVMCLPARHIKGKEYDMYKDGICLVPAKQDAYKEGGSHVPASKTHKRKGVRHVQGWDLSCAC